MSEAKLSLEKTITGGLLMQPSLYFEVSEYLLPMMFTAGTMRLIADELISTIADKGEVNISEFVHSVSLKHEGISELSILEMVQSGSIVSFVPLCEKLKEVYLNENEVSLAHKSINRITSGESHLVVIPEIESEREILHALTEKTDDNRLKDFNSAMDEIIKARQSTDGITGIDTGFKELNEWSGGWQDTDLIVLAGRPGMGKTTVGIQCAVKSAYLNKSAAFFSLEMGNTQIIKKILSIETKIQTDRMRTGNITDVEEKTLGTQNEQIYSLPIYIEDNYFDLVDIRNRARILKRKHDIQLIVIDYIQLMNYSAIVGNREQEISGITRMLKRLAKELNIPIIALSQLNRSVETRGGTKRPMLSDLRESGAIEQDADIVIFVYRSEYYDILTYENGDSTINQAELIVAKHRHGKTGTIKTGFEGRFYDLEVEMTPLEITQQNIIKRSSNFSDLPF